MGLVDSHPDTYLPRDSISNGLEILEPEHGRIHAGAHFTVTHVQTTGTATAVTVLFTTPSTASGIYIHFICGVESDKQVAIWGLYENPTATGGSALTPLNNDRKSSISNPLSPITYGATVTTVGTVLEQHTMGTTSGPTRTGGNINTRNEWILKPGTKYLISATPAGASTKVNIILPYYYR